MAPRKVRLVAHSVKGLHTTEAEAQLMLRAKRATTPVIKLIRAGIASAREKGMNPNALVIKTFQVDQGPMLKRVLPAAMGRANTMQKKMSHLTLVLAEGKAILPPFNIVRKKPKTAKETVKPIKKTERTEKNKEKNKVVVEDKNTGIMKKIFRRKSV